MREKLTLRCIFQTFLNLKQHKGRSFLQTCQMNINLCLTYFLIMQSYHLFKNVSISSSYRLYYEHQWFSSVSRGLSKPPNTKKEKWFCIYFCIHIFCCHGAKGKMCSFVANLMLFCNETERKYCCFRAQGLLKEGIISNICLNNRPKYPLSHHVKEQPVKETLGLFMSTVSHQKRSFVCTIILQKVFKGIDCLIISLDYWNM
jgi:hypothetical protein